ncbi:MAG: ABC transporter ATP-binding protein, partial [Pseudomonadota bacterium]
MLAVRQVNHRFGDTEVLNGIDLEVAAGEIVCLLGASGSGKSTLLRIIAGLEPLQSGTLEFADAALAVPGREPDAEDRQFGLVFQDHVLFPHMSVGDNVGFGLKGMSASARAEQVRASLAGVGLADFADRYPHTLSGGQQQRVALARALAPAPRLMLLDEPFASVDSTLRRQLREDARRALRESGVPAIVVTHDAGEAMEIADRIAVMDAGRIVQVGTPQAVWQQPVNAFVAQLFGDTDAIPGDMGSEGLSTPFGTLTAFTAADNKQGPFEVIVRPSAVTITPDPSGSAVLQDLRFLGHGYLMIIAAGEQRLRAM